MSSKRILLMVLCGLLAFGVQAGAQGLGDGRGIDHVASLVRLENFDAGTGFMANKLGFDITPALICPIGAKIRLIWFDYLSYLEVYTFTERNDFTAPFLDFLDQHE